MTIGGSPESRGRLRVGATRATGGISIGSTLGVALMTSLGPRFCPRCGTARVAEMPFCPGCGQNVAEFDEGAPVGAGHQATATEVGGGASTGPAGTSQA